MEVNKSKIIKELCQLAEIMNQQARKRNEAWVQTKPNQRSEQGQKRINLLKEQAEDIEYEEVYC